MDSKIKDSCWINFMMVKSHQIISNCWFNRRIYDPLHSIKLQFSCTNSSIETDYSTWLRNNKLRVVKKLDNVKRFSWKGHLERTRSWKVFNWIVWSWKDSSRVGKFRRSCSPNVLAEVKELERYQCIWKL